MGIERAAARAAADRDLNFGFQRRYGQVYNDAYRFPQSGKVGPLRITSARFIKSASPRALVPAPAPKSFDEKVKNWYL
jgi:predicted dehydrogenase